MSQENLEIEIPRTLRVLAGVVLGIAALPFVYLGFGFPIAAAVSDSYQDDPYYMNLIYGGICLAVGAFLAWSGWRLLRPSSARRSE